MITKLVKFFFGKKKVRHNKVVGWSLGRAPMHFCLKILHCMKPIPVYYFYCMQRHTVCQGNFYLQNEKASNQRKKIVSVNISL